MRRRAFIAGLGGATLVLGSFAARGQSPSRPFQIAFLSATSKPANERNREGFVGRLQELHRTSGRDYIIIERYADGMSGRLPELAQELVELKPDLILAGTSVVARVFRARTAEIPIVSPLLSDPIGSGLIAGYGRPGGNVTGVLPTIEGLVGKQIALGRELIPVGSKIGMLYTESTRVTLQQEAEAAAAQLSLELVTASVAAPGDVDRGFDTLAKSDVNLVFVPSDPMLFAEGRKIAAAALTARVPTVFSIREDVDAGGLMSYGVDYRDNFRRAADYVDKIMRGARPADLPVELPTKFELVINLKTAKALGLAIPPTLLARADEVIE
jgi:putative tryptophan/tyrosine transport system substrate-binding protein